MGQYCSAFAKIIAVVCSAYIHKDNVHGKMLLQPAVEAVTCCYTNKEMLTNIWVLVDSENRTEQNRHMLV